MKVNKTSAYTCLKPMVDSNNNVENILDFSKDFNENYANFKDVNLILDFSNNINTTLDEIFIFSLISKKHRNSNKSFVIVYENAGVDSINDDIVAVPTFQEALDVIEIEELERELGI